MSDTPGKPVCDFGCADHTAKIVEYPDELMMSDPALRSIIFGDPDDPVIVTIDADPVICEIADGAALAVLRRVEAEALVRR